MPPSLPSDDGEPGVRGWPLIHNSFRLASLFWNTEISALMMAKEADGGPVVPEAQVFQKSRTLVVPKQKETQRVPLVWEIEPTNFLTLVLCLRGKIWEAKIIL